MFNISGKLPSSHEVQAVLDRVHEQKSVEQEELSEEIKCAVDALCRKFFDYLARVDAPGMSKEEKQLKLLPRFLRQNSLRERTILHITDGGFKAAPIGLLALAILSRQHAHQGVNRWLVHMREIAKGATTREVCKMIEEGQLIQKMDRMIDMLRAENARLTEKSEQLEERVAGQGRELLQTREHLQQAEAQLQRTGEIPPAYVRRPEDPEDIPGLFDNPESTHAASFNGLRTMDALVARGIERTLTFLIDYAERTGKYHVNTSSSIALAPECEAHRSAIVTFFVFKLISGACLRSPQQEGRCHGDPKVVFNDCDLFLQSSRPVQVALSRDEPPMVVFRNPTEWAMKPDPQNFPHGIDPVALKYLLTRMNDREREHFRHLVLDPFLNLEDGLIEAYRFRDSAAGANVRVAYDLAFTMARALLKTYPAVIGQQLLAICSEDLEPFHRVEAAPAPAVPVEKLLRWRPNMAIIPEPLIKPLQSRQLVFNTLWGGRMPELLNPAEEPLQDGQILSTSREAFKAQLKKHFHIKHNFIGSNCRIATLATLFFQRPIHALENGAIMDAIANYLDTPEAKETFEEKLERAGYKIPALQRAYREDRESLLEDDLEIEIAAHAFRITIGMFVPGMAVKRNPQGLIEPTLFYGPSPATRDRVYMLTDGGTSFYALEPRFTVPEGNTDKMLADLIQASNGYWANSVDHEDIGLLLHALGRL